MEDTEEIRRKLLEIEKKLGKEESLNERIRRFIEHIQKIYPDYKIISYSLIKNVLSIKFLINNEILVISGVVNNLDFLEWHIRKTIKEFLEKIKIGDKVRIRGNRFLGEVIDIKGNNVVVKLENGYIIVVKPDMIIKI